MEHVWSATSKAGKIYIGDPCYVMKDSVYHGVWGDQHGFDNGEFEAEGVKFAIGGTAYGDGEYYGSDGTSFPVDAGVLGAVPIELFDEEKAKRADELGLIVDAEKVVLEYDDTGLFTFTFPGDSIYVDTLGNEDEDEDEDESEYCPECGRYVGPGNDGCLCSNCEEDEDEEEDLDESTKRFTSSFRAGLREAKAPKVKWYLMERDNPQLGTYWVAKGPFTKADAPGKSKSVYGSSTYHAFDTEEEYNAKIAELKANGERVRDY